MAMSPTSRSLKYLRENGFRADVVERKRGRFITVDCFGIADILAFDGPATVLVQTTTAAHLMDRVRKVVEDEGLRKTLFEWCNDPFRSFEFHGWSKRGGRGEKKLWHVKIMTPTELLLPALLQEPFQSGTANLEEIESIFITQIKRG